MCKRAGQPIRFRCNPSGFKAHRNSRLHRQYSVYICDRNYDRKSYLGQGRQEVFRESYVHYIFQGYLQSVSGEGRGGTTIAAVIADEISL